MITILIRIYYGLQLGEKPRDMQDFFERWRCVWSQEDLLRSHEATAEHLCERYWATFNQDPNPLLSESDKLTLRILKVKHMSMSMGDVIEVDGRMYWAASVGFEKLDLKPRLHYPAENLWLWVHRIK